MTTEYDRLIVNLASSSDGIVTRQALHQAGVSDKAIRSRAGGLLEHVARGVYLVGNPSDRTWLRAAIEATPHALVADLSAAKLHQLPARRPQTPTVVALHGTKRRNEIEAVHHRQTRWLPPEDQTICDGFPVTSVERTVCDLATSLFQRQFRHLVEWSITEKRMTVASFQACVQGYARRGRRGSTIVRQTSIDLLGTDAIVGSVLERDAIDLFRRAHLPNFEVQFRPPWYDGIAGVVDVAWPKFRLIVELDGRRWHSTSAAMANDRIRDRRATAAGWQVLRFGWQEIAERPSLVTREIAGMIFRPAVHGPSAA